MRPLPKTYHDGILKRRPEMVKECREIADAIRKEPSWDGYGVGMTTHEALLRAAVHREFERTLTEMWKRNPRLRHAPREEAFSYFVNSSPETAQRFHTQYTFDCCNLVNLALFGDKTFYVAEALSERLSETEIDAPCEDVLPPFQACKFIFTDEFMRGAVAAGDPGIVHDQEPVIVYVVLVKKESGFQFITTTVLGGPDRPLQCFKREIPLERGMTIEQAMRKDWGNNGEVIPNADEDDSRFYGPLLRLYRVILNTMLYLSSPDPDVSAEIRAKDRYGEAGIVEIPGMSRGRREEVEAKKREFSSSPYVEVGGNLKLLGLHHFVPGHSGSLTERFLVRGHWRHQAHGPALSQRRWMIIWPFMKGPEDGEVAAKPYLVG